MEHLLWFAFGVAPPVVGVTLLGLFFWLLWYALIHCSSPVPPDELAGLSVETREMLGRLDSERPISRGDLAKVRRLLRQASLRNEQRQALSDVEGQKK